MGYVVHSVILDLTICFILNMNLPVVTENVWKTLQTHSMSLNMYVHNMCSIRDSSLHGLFHDKLEEKAVFIITTKYKKDK